MPRPLRPLLGITLGCALLAGVAVTAAGAYATTSTTSPASAPSTTAAGAKAPRSNEELIALVRARALASQNDAAAGSVGVRSAVDPDLIAEPEPTPEPTPPAPEPTTDPTTGPSPTAPATEPPPTATPTPAPTSPAPTDPPADTTPPTGTFVLSTTGLWTGQTLTLTQSALADGTNDPNGISRVVSWGDGTTTTVQPGATTVSKKYTKKGKFTVSVTLTDAAGNTAKAKIAKPTVAVTVPGATFKLSKKAVFHHESFKVTISKVPTGTTKIVLNRGDGYLKALKGKNQAVTVTYLKRPDGRLVSPGKITLRATFTNKNGAAAPVTVGTVTLKKDSWKPTVKFTKPARSKANKASAWSPVRGTTADKGSGVQKIQFIAVRANAVTLEASCFTTKRKWLKVDFENENQDLSSCLLYLKVSKGKWSHKVTGLKKNYVIVLDAVAIDWVGRESSAASVEQVLTRN